MTSLFGRALGVAAFALMATSVVAQETDALVAVMTDWSVFNPPEEPKICFGVSAPKETVNIRDGQPVSVRRGDILLFVTFIPGQPGAISFSGGYPFAEGSTVDLAIDGTSFQLLPGGEWAWPGSVEDDAILLAALKKGTTAVLKARSGKGTETTDTFSLRGFTAAMEDAEKRCK